MPEYRIEFRHISMWLPFVILLMIGRIGLPDGTGTVGAFLFGSDGGNAEQETPEPVVKYEPPPGKTPRRLLVFGGNGFMGAETVEKLVKLGDNVTLVNRGNWYWDSRNRIAPHVQSISCDRKNGVLSCKDLVELVDKTEKFDAVIDFSAYGPRELKDAIALLQGSGSSKGTAAKAAVYIYISTDSVYDVCDPTVRSPTGHLRESDAVRPSDPELRRLLADHHQYGNGKLEAEEELINQRKPSSENSTDSTSEKKPTGIPYVILRLPDVIGPRDTTYRFWFYQLWIRVAATLNRKPVVVPKFLVGYNNSFVYVDDVARTVVELVDRTSSPDDKKQSLPIVDEVFNLAWPQNISLDGLLRDIESSVNKEGTDKVTFQTEDNDNLYFYPTVRCGPVDSSKATATIGWQPSDWLQAIKSTVEFYESAMKDPNWQTQRDEIVQIVSGQLYGAGEEREEFLSTVEKIYGIDLSHFRPKREEL